MHEQNNGGPAFPQHGFDNIAERFTSQGGMTLRDYFAAKAMQAICTSKDEAGTLLNHGYEWISSEAYKIADAMLKSRQA